jgi:chemotaxis signal transduction protein
VSGETGAQRGAGNLARDFAHDFDRSFAAPARSGAVEVETLLTLRLRGDPYAVRLRDVTGLLIDRKIVSLPSRTPALLGIVGLRSGVTPVYSLSALLGYGAGGPPARWLLLVGPGPLLGLAFEEFDGHRQAARTEVSSVQDPRAGNHLPESVCIDDISRGLISVAALIETIKSRSADRGPTKER